MNTLTITREHLDSDNTYIGGVDVSGYDGDIVIAPNLGDVRFPGSVSATGSIRAGRGSGISAATIVACGDLVLTGGANA